jgi:DNA-directed RNA polymerase subunit RPC12/RpoP
VSQRRGLCAGCGAIIAAEAKTRDGYRCTRCGAEGVQLIAHHRPPLVEQLAPAGPGSSSSWS